MCDFISLLGREDVNYSHVSSYHSLVRFFVLPSSCCHLTWLEIPLWSLLHCLYTTRLKGEIYTYSTKALHLSQLPYSNFRKEPHRLSTAYCNYRACSGSYFGPNFNLQVLKLHSHLKFCDHDVLENTLNL